MKRLKRFNFGQNTIEIQQDLTEGFGLHVWPSAMDLAQFIADHGILVENKNVLELGAGVALPGLVAAKFRARQVVLTDKYENVLRNCRDMIQINGLAATVSTALLDWGDFGTFSREICSDIQIVLGSDCLYNTEDFEPLLATVHYIFSLNQTECVFYTTYHLRSVTRSIAHLLQHWALEATVIACENETIFLLKITAAPS